MTDPYVFDAGKGSAQVPFMRSFDYTPEMQRQYGWPAHEVRIEVVPGRAYGLSWWQAWSLEVGDRVADAWANPDGWHFAGSGTEAK